MTRLTSAPTTPTSSEICAPKSTRENKSRPCKSVPNQCCASGGANCASESWSGLCNLREMRRRKFSRQPATRTIASQQKNKKPRAENAGAVFFEPPPRALARAKSRCWLMLTSFIFHARVEQGVGKVHHQIQCRSAASRRAARGRRHGVIAVQRAVDEKNADAGNLKNIFDDERAGQQIRQHRAGIGNDRQNGDADGVLEQQRIFAQTLGARGGDKFGLRRRSTFLRGKGARFFRQKTVRARSVGKIMCQRRFPKRDGQHISI